MNDYYSNYSSPSEVEIKNTLFKEVQAKNPYCKKEDIMKCIDEAFEDFGGLKNMGSLSGWLMYSKKALLQMVNARLNSTTKDYDTSCNSQSL